MYLAPEIKEITSNFCKLHHCFHVFSVFEWPHHYAYGYDSTPNTAQASPLPSALTS